VAVIARMTTELEEFKRAENSPSLWKLHTDSLLALLEVAAALSESVSRVVGDANAPGSTAAAEIIKDSVQRLRHRCDLIADTLAPTKRMAQTV
jgi:hypothetical protein